MARKLKDRNACSRKDAPLRDGNLEGRSVVMAGGMMGEREVFVWEKGKVEMGGCTMRIRKASKARKCVTCSFLPSFGSRPGAGAVDGPDCAAETPLGLVRVGPWLLFTGVDANLSG